jgi:ribonuclease Y
MDTIITIIAAVAALIIGFILGKILSKANIQEQINKAKLLEESAKKDAEVLIKDAQSQAESVKREKMMEAKEHFIKLKEEHNQEVEGKNRKIQEGENRIKQKEQSFNDKLQSVGRQEKENEDLKIKLTAQLEAASKKREELQKSHDEHISKLEQVAKLSAEDARAQLVLQLKESAQTEAMSHIKTVMDEAKLKANKEAKKIIIQSIQRTAAENAIENTVSVFNLASDDQKGQIIGREGRNIRALEAATGVEIIVDDTPEAIIISGYDPYKEK